MLRVNVTEGNNARVSIAISIIPGETCRIPREIHSLFLLCEISVVIWT